MEIIVVKRDGTEEMYDEAKVSESIMGAAIEVGGEDYDLSEELAEKVTDLLLTNDIKCVTSAELEVIIRNMLIDEGHSSTATKYIEFASARSKQREMDTSLMHSYEEITFQSGEESDMKRENANINSESSMGVMLKYGSEGAKKFNLNYIIDPKISKYHIEGDIHIHDLDFYALTETCALSSTKVIVKINGVIKMTTFGELFEELGINTIDKVVYLDNSIDLEVLSDGKFVKVKNLVTHSSEGKRVIKIKTNTGTLELTDGHRVPVLNSNKEYEYKKVKDIKLNDILKINELNTNLFSENNTLDIIDLYDGDNLIIVNTAVVIEDIKNNCKWKEFCDIFNYKECRNIQIRSGRAKMLVSEYKKIEHLTKLKHSDLKLAYKRTRSDESIDAVIKMDYNLGRFIGLMYAEGSIGEYENIKQESDEKKACFCNYDEELIDEFNSITRKIFNNASLRDRTHQGRLTGTYLSGYLHYELFNSVFGSKVAVNDIRLADWMYTANKEFVSGLISGLIDGDGCVQKDGYRICISSVSLNMLENLQYLLLLRGIDSSIKKSSSTKDTIASFEKNEEIIESVRNYDNYKLEFTGNLDERLGWIDSIKINNTELSKTRKEDTINVRVMALEEIDYTDIVYDMETDDHHFNANGFVVHNCCQIPLDKLFKGGFNTGHGFLREPGNIRSAGALAAIAIQSNQNDQHRRRVA